MKKLTYKEAYDKIIEAYFKDEIQPYDSQFCFCGTLCNNSDKWHGFTNSNMEMSWHRNYFGYTGDEYVKMERALLNETGKSFGKSHKEYENYLFAGMCAALEVLKQIHKERGEDVDGVQEFKKRELVK